ELLDAAREAAAFCRDGDYELMRAARDGLYVPPLYEPHPDAPDVHEMNEAYWFRAETRVEEIEERQARESTLRQEAERLERSGEASSADPSLPAHSADTAKHESAETKAEREVEDDLREVL